MFLLFIYAIQFTIGVTLLYTIPLQMLDIC